MILPIKVNKKSQFRKYLYHESEYVYKDLKLLKIKTIEHKIRVKAIFAC